MKTSVFRGLARARPHPKDSGAGTHAGTFTKYAIIFLFLFLAGCTREPESRKQIIHLNLGTEPPTLDSRKVVDATSANVLLMLFEGLTRIGFDHKPYPGAAETIEISPDQKTYVFKLKECHWSNGNPVTSYDFRYACETILKPDFPSPFAYKLFIIQNAKKVKDGKMPVDSLGIETPDEKTLIVHLKHPVPYFLELTAFPTFFPIPKNSSAAEYVSNGPFQLKKWEHEDEIVLEKNPFYWGKDRVYLEEIHLTMIGDATTEFYMYEMGELDWTGSPLTNLPPDFVGALKDENRVDRMDATGVYYYKLNTDRFPLNNQNIRKALGAAVNREAIVAHITQGGQKAALGMVPPMPRWESSQTFLKDCDRNQAKELFEKGLAEIGVSRENFPKLILSFNTNREHQKIAEALQHQWKETLGIDIELENYDWKVYLAKVAKQDYQISRTGWISDFHDPISFLEPFKYKDDENNGTGWENSNYISFLERANEEVSTTKRCEYLKKAENLLIDEMAVIPIYYISFNYMKKPYVKNVYLSPLGFIDLINAFIEE